jgi:hypothetical protein
MIYIKLAAKESCDMTARILYTRVPMTVHIPALLYHINIMQVGFPGSFAFCIRGFA